MARRTQAFMAYLTSRRRGVVAVVWSQRAPSHTGLGFARTRLQKVGEGDQSTSPKRFSSVALLSSSRKSLETPHWWSRTFPLPNRPTQLQMRVM